MRQFPTLGGELDDRLRIEQLVSGAPIDGYLLRTPSGLLEREDGPARSGWALLAPEVDVEWNSAIPFSLNDGALWSGRGLNARVLAGARVRYGAVTATLAPQLVYQQNREFDVPPFEPGERSEFTLPWYVRAHSADLPLRFGNESSLAVDPGQSSLRVDAGPVAVGAATESQWWGPGIRNAIVMSSNAPGIPHLFLGTRGPVRTRFATVEARWIFGKLAESEYFDSTTSNDRRTLSALVATLSPSWEPNLTLGVARSVYTLLPDDEAALGRFADVLTRWKGRDDPTPDADRRYDQILSLFGRWVLPDDGLEFYGEWARQDLPSTFREALDHTGYSHGYTLGLQWARTISPDRTLRVQSEFTNLEQSPSPVGPIDSYYTSAAVPQGYTHRGQVIGAAIGPGASSQWAAADYLASGWRIGLFGGRIRWDDDAYMGTPRAQILAWPFLAHDVSVFGGVRGSYASPAFRVDAELATGVRYNFLFQNRGRSWETASDAVDVRNHTLSLVVTPFASRGARPRAGVAPVVPPADAAPALPAAR